MRVFAVVSFLGFLGYSLGAYPTSIDKLHDSLITCSALAQSNIDCTRSVQDGLQKLIDYIQKVRDLKTHMDKVNRAFDTVETLLKIAKYFPGIEKAVEALKSEIDEIRPQFNVAYIRIKAIDAEMYPWKGGLEREIENCKEAIVYLQRTLIVCEYGHADVENARSCLDSMQPGFQKVLLANLLETMAKVMAPSVNSLITALEVIRDSCGAMSSITDIVLGWADIEYIVDAMDDMYRALKPILEFLVALQRAMDKEICITAHPREPLSEEIDLVKLKELAETMYPGRPSDAICFSVQDILEGFVSTLHPLSGLATKSIETMVSSPPQLTLPELPNFTNLLNLNVDFNLPRAHLELDHKLLDHFQNFNFGCARDVKKVCSTGYGKVSFDCSSVTGFTGGRESSLI